MTRVISRSAKLSVFMGKCEMGKAGNIHVTVERPRRIDPYNVHSDFPHVIIGALIAIGLVILEKIARACYFEIIQLMHPTDSHQPSRQSYDPLMHRCCDSLANYLLPSLLQRCMCWSCAVRVRQNAYRQAGWLLADWYTSESLYTVLSLFFSEDVIYWWLSGCEEDFIKTNDQPNL